MSRQLLLVCAALTAGGAVLLGWPGHAAVARSLLPDLLRQPAVAVARRLRPPPDLPITELLAGLAAELSAGQPTDRALVAAAAELEPMPCPQAVAACRTGGDVAVALRQDATAPGAHALRGLAACWEVAERSGAGLSLAVGRLAQGLRSSAEAEAQLSGELAAVRTSARMLAGLPALGLAIGHWIGAGPVAWLTSSWIGRAVLLAGVALQLVGMVWLRTMVARTRARL